MSSDGEDSMDEGDIQALARSTLGPGEQILGEGRSRQVMESRAVNLKPQLLQKAADLDYKVPEGAKRVPWIDTLMLEGAAEWPTGVDVKKGVELEISFMQRAAEAVKEAYRRLRVMKVPCTRPSDFYAEMLRSDDTMYRVRQRAAEEQRRIRIVEERKKSQAAKKFAKKSKSKKQEVRAKEKQKTLDNIAAWRKAAKQDKNTDDQDLEDILNKRASGKDAAAKGKGKGKGKPKKSKKREMYDKKFGYGGKKRLLKSNDTKSLNDFSSSPWAKGKGKGRSKGKGKGKGMAKGGGKGLGKRKGGAAGGGGKRRK